MSNTVSVTASSQVRLSKDHLGMTRGAEPPTESLEYANQLLQRNHDEHHMFWRDFAGHNHTAHNVLTRVALGATPSELQKGFNHNLPGQRPPPQRDNQIIQDMYDEDKFYGYIGDIAQYTNFMVFFEQIIEARGYKDVINEYCFSRTRIADAMLARLYDGAFHSIIHVGLGVEFEQASIVAEGLAQAATDASVNIGKYFLDSEKEAQQHDAATSPSLVSLIHAARADPVISTAAKWEDFGVAKMRDGVLGRAGNEITSLMARYRVTPETLERRLAEMISCVAYMAGAAQKPGKARKIDFFYMHDVTSSIFLSVLCNQPWIRLEDKVRMVEWKGRIDLVWYATCGAAPLDIESVNNYVAGPSAGMDWSTLFKAINDMHDDGHVAKFCRALKNGEQTAKKFEQGDGAEDFPVKGDAWLNIARMSYDSTLDLPAEQKWVAFVGFDVPWATVPNL